MQMLDGAALERAETAAAAAGETLPAFLARAVQQAADADARERPLEFQALNRRPPEILGTYHLNRKARKLWEADGLNRDAGKLRG